MAADRRHGKGRLAQLLAATVATAQTGHGDIDDNVPVTQSFQLATALIRAGRDVDMVVLPDTTHAVYQPFFWRKFRDYFVQHLLGEAPPADVLFDAPAWREELPLLRPEK